MKSLTFFNLLVILFSFFACSSDDSVIIDEPESRTFLFEDGFETENLSIDELILADTSRWTNIQQVDPTNATNVIELSTAQFSEGQQSLRIVSNESDAILSKVDIEKGGLDIQAGDRVTISADFYINSDESLQNLFLIDLECCSCWDPSVADNQCPGVRLMMSNGNDFLSIERGKIDTSTIRQTNFPFPREQWVSVVWEMTLSDTDIGSNNLTINGEEVINEAGMNMPNAQVFRNLFAAEGINFTLQEPTSYERVQVGATANPDAGTIEMFVDNFSIEVE